MGLLEPLDRRLLQSRMRLLRCHSRLLRQLQRRLRLHNGSSSREAGRGGGHCLRLQVLHLLLQYSHLLHGLLQLRHHLGLHDGWCNKYAIEQDFGVAVGDAGATSLPLLESSCLPARAGPGRG